MGETEKAEKETERVRKIYEERYLGQTLINYSQKDYAIDETIIIKTHFHLTV